MPREINIFPRSPPILHVSVAPPGLEHVLRSFPGVPFGHPRTSGNPEEEEQENKGTTQGKHAINPNALDLDSHFSANDKQESAFGVECEKLVRL
jgi:hypothetical protein